MSSYPEQMKSKPAEYERWKNYYVNVRQVLEQGQELAVKPEQAREVVRVIEAVRESAATGNVVSF